MDRKPPFRRSPESSSRADAKDGHGDVDSLRDHLLHQQIRSNPSPSMLAGAEGANRGRLVFQWPTAPVVSQELVSRLQKVIEKMPAEDTREYFYAARHVPHLVQLESDPAKFLQCCDLDLHTAAKKLVRYWKRRSVLFGSKAFLPMTWAENGALDGRLLDYLQSTHSAILPKDITGRSVFCDDNARRVDHDQKLRCQHAFYIAHLLAENPLSQTEGFVGISILQAMPRYDESSQASGQDLLNTLPIRVKAWHIIDFTANGEASTLFDSTFQRCLSFPSTIHRYSNTSALLSSLGMFGLTPNGLPLILGGKWSYGEYLQWLTERKRIEQQSAPASLPFAAAASAEPVGRGDRHSDRNEQENIFELALSQIPDSQKQSYLEAIEKAPPAFWEYECNKKWFLEAEDYDCNQAALRLTRYCELRSETFGDKRFSTLNQSSEDALSRSDLNVMNTIFLLPLPDDSSGCPVLSIDGNRLPPRPSRGTTQRNLFYIFSLLAEHGNSRKDGAVLLYNLGAALRINNHVKPEFLRRLSTCMPLRMKAVHLIHCADTPIPNDLASKFDFADNVFTHASSDITILASKLQQHGLEQKDLPKSLGGEWGTEKFCQWQEMRTRCEWRLPLGLSGRNVTSGLSEFPAIRPYTPLDDGETNERKRRLNVIHTRRKRDRVRIEIEVLREQIQELEAKKARYTQENQRLTELLQSAIELVQRPTFSEVGSRSL